MCIRCVKKKKKEDIAKGLVSGLVGAYIAEVQTTEAQKTCFLRLSRLYTSATHIDKTCAAYISLSPFVRAL